MRNTITLNGTSSASISGMLVESLPPITKPPIRTQIEEIDGVDGDTINVLGYGAYDKEARIGLYGAFDVDQVIAFFDSAGEVIFSNEPGKIYRYAITEQIDFERLIRFRRGGVVFHVQPFKYDANETPIEATFTYDDESVTVTNAGNIYSKPVITITGTGNVNLYIGETQILYITLDTDETITLDVEKLDAYDGTTLKNRQITGNMENLVFAPGENDLSWTGTVSEITITRYSRWI